MKKEVRFVTAAEAQALLDGQQKNRPLSESMVSEMIEDVKAGTFDKDEANVCLRENGTLYYGQHILTVVVRQNDGLELNVYQIESTDRMPDTAQGYLNRHSKYRYKIFPRR